MTPHPQTELELLLEPALERFGIALEPKDFAKSLLDCARFRDAERQNEYFMKVFTSDEADYLDVRRRACTSGGLTVRYTYSILATRKELAEKSPAEVEQLITAALQKKNGMSEAVTIDVVTRKPTMFSEIMKELTGAASAEEISIGCEVFNLDIYHGHNMTVNFREFSCDARLGVAYVLKAVEQIRKQQDAAGK